MVPISTAIPQVTNNYGTFTKIASRSVLRHLWSCYETTCLQALSNSVSWSIYLDSGKIIYASHSVAPFDRLERHLRRLSHQIPTLTDDIRLQMRVMFEAQSSPQSTKHPEYEAICWLINQQYLNHQQAALLIQELVKEVIESFLAIKQGSYELTNSLDNITRICNLDVEKILNFCQQRLQAWQSMAPVISSPYQRPYLWIQNTNNPQKILLDTEKNLTHWLKGLSLRHLAVILNQDELQLAKNIYPYIINGGIVLHAPDPPFDKLPMSNGESNSLIMQSENPFIVGSNQGVIGNGRKYNTKAESENVNPATTGRKHYKIVAVDESLTLLREISRFLDDEVFSVITISEPLHAPISIIRHQPDLILVDLNMAGIDGYELCRMIRSNSKFKHTPIIMVTGTKGIVEQVKARFMGVSGYLSKPFTRADLLKIIFMHLS
ncbi:MAG: response regulator [Nostocaceae cyanobacterium]|nr:response regulator [Nostocaceae cyanobacterium]